MSNDTQVVETVVPGDGLSVDCILTFQNDANWVGHLVFTNVGSSVVCLPEYKLLLTSDPGFKAFTLQVDGVDVVYGGKMIKRRNDGKERCLSAGESIEVDFDLSTVYPQLAADAGRTVSVKYNSHSIHEGKLVSVVSNEVVRSR